MDITIIAIGTIKFNFIKKGIETFLLRLKNYTKLKILNLKEFNNKNVKENKLIETKKIIQLITKKYQNNTKILLDINGILLSSFRFAQIINDIKNFKSGKIVFIIGGSNGVDKIIDNYIDLKISFGKITMPHQLFQLVLVEQIYRSFKIINNEKYHK